MDEKRKYLTPEPIRKAAVEVESESALLVVKNGQHFEGLSIEKIFAGVQAKLSAEKVEQLMVNVP